MNPESRGQYIVMPMADPDKTLGLFEGGLDAAIAYAIRVSQPDPEQGREKPLPYGVFLRESTGEWKTIGVAYDGEYTPATEGKGL